MGLPRRWKTTGSSCRAGRTDLDHSGFGSKCPVAAFDESSRRGRRHLRRYQPSRGDMDGRGMHVRARRGRPAGDDPFLVSLLRGRGTLTLASAGIFTLSIGRVLVAELLARERPRYIVWASSAAVVANVIGNLLLVPRMGISGASLASSVSYSIMSGVVTWYYRRVTGCHGELSFHVPRICRPTEFRGIG